MKAAVKHLLIASIIGFIKLYLFAIVAPFAIFGFLAEEWSTV